MSKPICSFPECANLVRSVGLCDSHYAQKRRGKELAPLGGKSITVHERFWRRVTKTETCWIWNGSKDSEGYGSIRFNGKNHPVHRVSYTWSKGDIPNGLAIDHICHNTSCVNPAHLRLATIKQNREHVLGAQSTSRSGIRGAIWSGSKQKWEARVGHNGKRYYAGYYDTPEEAGEAARLKRLELFTHNDLDR